MSTAYREGPEPQAETDQLRLPSYTPPRRQLDGLLSRFLASSDATEERLLAAALRRTAADALAHGQRFLSRTDGPQRVRLVGLLARLALDILPRDPTVVTTLVQLAADPEPRAARQAVIALGKLPAEQAASVEPVLLERFRQASLPADRRALAETLGKIGGARSLAVIREAIDETRADGSVLAQALDKAALRLERGLARPGTVGAMDTAPIRLDAPLPGTYAVTLRCRAGLTAVLCDELRDRGLLGGRRPLARAPSGPHLPATSGQPGHVTLEWSRPLDALFAARTFSSLSFPLPCPAAEPGDDGLVVAVADALAAPAVRSLLRALSGEPGTIRYRFQFSDGGHHRALVHRLATAVATAAPELLNDPQASPWQIEVTLPDRATRLSVEIVPRRLADPRFLYRKRDVAAASHPPLAAALARLAGIGPSDVVWDPFVGSGSELIEAALAGSRRLFGTDLDDDALAAARENAAAAGVRPPELAHADALTWWPPPGAGRPTRIITNPPMGRRTRPGHLATFLDAFLRHAADVLAPGGRLVWISPQPRLTADRGAAAGLRLVSARSVDLNGFWGTLEVWERPGGP